MEVLKRAFTEADENGNGYIEGKELAKVLRAAGVQTTKGEYIEIMEALSDEDEDGRIDFKEFCMFFRGKIGTQTNSKFNRLMVKPVLGRSKHSSYDLPGKYHTYGAKCPRDSESAKDIILTWKPFKQENNKDDRKINILKMNKRAIRDKHISPKDITEYNRANPIYETKSSKAKTRTKATRDVLNGRRSLPNGKPFGRVNVKAESITKLVKMEYSAKDERREAFYPGRNAASNRKSKRDKKKGYDPRKPTKASVGHGYGARKMKEVPKEPFKMKRFMAVEPRVRSNFSQSTEGTIVAGESESEFDSKDEK